MRYLIIYKDNDALRVAAFEYAEHWAMGVLCVIDEMHDTITFDGRIWRRIVREKF